MFKKNSTFIIAEVGINHNGNLKIAKKLITAAKKCGADAVKFQSFKTEELIIKESKKAEHVKGKQSFFEMIKSWELSDSDYIKLADFAKKEGIIFFASIFGKQSLNIMEKIKAPLYKIASCDLNNHYLLKKVAKTKKPIIISVGMGDINEINQAVKILEKNNNELGILHCVSLYPPQAQELNLQRIALLKKKFPKHIVGYSDHTLDIFTPASTILLGAEIIEKHFTLDKNMPGPDQPSSANPAEFKKMVEEIRFLEKAINHQEKKITPSAREKKMSKVFRRSLVAEINIPKNTVITEAMLGVKRPGTGIPSSVMDKVIGKKAKINLIKNAMIKYSNLK
ncbi:MAG: N-acetylneuraminate synthase family protein [Patescibacteria group bacterium]|jgi:N-acetylneuraminate synthase/N,N'-diacetyllegionaminate synthase